MILFFELSSLLNSFNIVIRKRSSNVFFLSKSFRKIRQNSRWFQRQFVSCSRLIAFDRNLHHHHRQFETRLQINSRWRQSASCSKSIIFDRDLHHFHRRFETRLKFSAWQKLNFRSISFAHSEFECFDRCNEWADCRNEIDALIKTSWSTSRFQRDTCRLSFESKTR